MWCIHSAAVFAYVGWVGMCICKGSFILSMPERVSPSFSISLTGILLFSMKHIFIDFCRLDNLIWFTYIWKCNFSLLQILLGQQEPEKTHWTVSLGRAGRQYASHRGWSWFYFVKLAIKEHSSVHKYHFNYPQVPLKIIARFLIRPYVSLDIPK